jgi:hypothetical protein
LLRLTVSPIEVICKPIFMNSFRQLLRRGIDSRAVTLSDMETPLRAAQAAAAVARLMYGLSIAVAMSG